MKGKLNSSIAVTAALFLFAGSTKAGVLDILRGDTAAREPQRVAFVGAAQVIQVSGDAARLAGIDRWESLSKHANLQPGDVVRTQGGTVLLQMAESKSFVKLTPHTILRLVPLAEDWDRGVLSGREEQTGFLVRSCRGKAYLNKGQQWEPVQVNTVIARGSQLRTTPGATVDLFDTNLQLPVRIRGAAQLTLDEEVATRRVRTAPTLASARK